MTTKAQTHANRRNSQKSTGPRSAEGKAVVAKNAVKHGLLASEAVIKGENQEDFDLFRDEMIAELAPAGSMESILAERVVSLSWRLQRIERIQNLAIDAMIERQINSPLARMAEGMLPKSLRRDNTDGMESDLTLGKVAMRDCAGARVLERLLMYERRIENSLLKTSKELDRRKIMRQLEIAEEELSTDMDQPHPATIEQSPAQDKMTSHPHPDKRHQDEAATQSQKNAKQSQFAPTDIDVTSFTKEDYSINPASCRNKNKANPSTTLSLKGCLTARTGPPAFPTPATAFAVTSGRKS